MSFRVAFINISLREKAARRMLPVGLAYVMTAVQRAGIDFDLIDMDIDEMSLEDLEPIVSSKQYDAIGMGCIVTGFNKVRAIADLIKRVSPSTTIFAGNSVATSIPDLLLSNTQVDVAVLGEGDITNVELLQALQTGSGLEVVADLAYRRNNEIFRTESRPLIPDLNSIPHPDWDLFDLEKYDAFSRINMNVFGLDEVKGYPVSTARGCPHNCSFCYHVFKGKKYRRYNDDSIINEMRRLHENYDVNYFSFWDELSFPTKKSIKSLLKRMEDIDFNFGWGASCRAGLFTREDLDLVKQMREMGCNNVFFSLENASPEILSAMNKNISADQYVEQTKVLHEGGIIPTTSVIFGYPQETPETIRQTIETCERCDVFPSVGFLLPMPGTPIYDWALKKGLLGDELEYVARIGDRQDFHVNLTQMSDEEFVATVTTELEGLAKRQGIEVESVFKTTTYKSPKKS